MSKFKRVLGKSDEQLIINELGLDGVLAAVGKKTIQLAEQVVLEKLTEKYPVIYLYEGDLYAADDMGINDHIRKHGTPLYAHPMPSRQAAPKCTEGK